MWPKIALFIILVAIFQTNCDEAAKNNDDEKLVTRRFSPYKPNTSISTKGQKKLVNWKSLGEDRNEPQEENTTEATTDSTTTSVPTTTTQMTTRKWKPLNYPTKNTTVIRKKFKNDNSIKEGVCEHYKIGTVVFDLNKMADVWQTVYYQLPEKVHCFKIHIKKLTEEEKLSYSKQYGNFSGAVNWDECNLEVKAETQNNRRHFLQGINEDRGVMDNIILTATDDSSDSTSTVHEESADQWLVAHSMLLMRDCETGGVVVFAKIPHSPRVVDIKTALKRFGEPDMIGKLACDDEEHLKPFDAEEDINDQIN